MINRKGNCSSGPCIYVASESLEALCSFSLETQWSVVTVEAESQCGRLPIAVAVPENTNYACIGSDCVPSLKLLSPWTLQLCASETMLTLTAWLSHFSATLLFLPQDAH